MNFKQQARIIRELRRAIPDMQCKSGCHDCCGVVPMTFYEYKMMGKPEMTPDNWTTCPHLGKSGCSNYNERPLICRLYGTVKREPPKIIELAADIKLFNIERLHCPHGCVPQYPLDWTVAASITNKYLNLKPKVRGISLSLK